MYWGYHDMDYSQYAQMQSIKDGSHSFLFTLHATDCSSVSIKVGGHQLQPLDEVRDLGVTLDSNLTFKAHVNKICRSASQSIHYIGKIRKFLTQKDTERLVHAFI